ncbi:hypothetical protein OOZ19_24175 [Saccharopolyspora sp. NFXS83]|uniref:hypothetical protein n=1 Tax=Saccharopolyspora sp. NFXS83 TaxID=2993560 RepID=UPI00224AF6C5|nr:hypothetical protein [Saccharopolyspora sp. NFXS83]MCX2733352.1 hypothetical protein [Saccharopolyspora sp. NFXS83]
MSSPGGPGNWGSPENGASPQHGGHGGSRGGHEGWGSAQQPQRFGQQPYQGGMQYQGFGTFQQPQQSQHPQQGQHSPQGQWAQQGFGPPPPPKRNRGPLIAAVAAGAVVVVALVTAVAVASSRGEERAGPEPLPAPTSDSPPPPTSERTSTAAAPPPEAVVPGWQAVPVPNRHAVYDAPLEWELETPDNVVGFGALDDAVTMTGVAVYQEDFCAEVRGSYRAIAGATARRGPDDAAVATDTARKFAELAYGPDARIELSPVQPVQLAGGIPASKVVATVFPAPGPCGSPSVLINTLATNGDGESSVVHIAGADQGVPGAIPPEVLDRLTASLRPAG